MLLEIAQKPLPESVCKSMKLIIGKSKVLNAQKEVLLGRPREDRMSDGWEGSTEALASVASVFQIWDQKVEQLYLDLEIRRSYRRFYLNKESGESEWPK